MNRLPSLPLEMALRREWDVIVVGAGPAGGLSAYEAARRDASVLLVEKARFPRWKVCGCCLNARALSVLRAAGLDGLVPANGGVALERFRVGAGGRQAELTLPTGAALSRARLDAALVQAACGAGASFLSETTCTLGGLSDEGRIVLLRYGDRTGEVRGRIVIGCGGLGGRFVREYSPDPPPGPGARIGAGAVAQESPGAYESGVIHMACGRHGYVGLVRVEDGQLNIAAAFDPAFIKDCHGLGAAASHVLDEAGFAAIPGLEDLVWRGTPALTRRAARLALPRTFLVGDATGYVEPFTGEGMAWALTGAAALAPLVQRSLQTYDSRLEREWENAHARLVRGRQLICRAVAAGLRHPLLVNTAVGLLSRRPSLAQPFIRHINDPFEEKGLLSP